MCFTPEVSITTALIEFAISIYILLKTKSKRLYSLVFFVFLLGFYQFTEFMLCTTSSPELWAKLGFATYTFLPILIYHILINFSKLKIKKFLYLIPSFFAILALLYPDFISSATCEYLHVNVKKLIFENNLLLILSYSLYYILFPAYGVYTFTNKINISKLSLKLKLCVIMFPVAVLGSILYFIILAINNGEVNNSWININYLIIISALIIVSLSLVFVNKLKKYFVWINLFIIAGTSILLYLLYYINPDFMNDFPSIYCQFALLYAISAVFAVDSIE
jgi:hypothetical protein